MYYSITLNIATCFGRQGLSSENLTKVIPHKTINTWYVNKVRELDIMDLYQQDKQSTKFTIWKY
jgi:hypothetical protein